MPVFYKGNRVPWTVPGINSDESINLDPADFHPDMLPRGRVDAGPNMTLIRIPKVPNRISTRKDGYIELILSRSYDREAKQSRNKKVIIGSDASDVLPGMMIPNENYYNLFNGKGQLFDEEGKTEAEEPAGEEREQEAPPDSQTQTCTDQEPAETAGEPTKFQASPNTIHSTAEEQTTDNITEETLKQREQAIREQEERLSQMEQLIKIKQHRLDEREAALEEAENQRLFNEEKAQKDHIRILSYMLESYTGIIRTQANRKPGQPMSLKQIRTINEVLQELRDFFRGCETEEYLHLAEEPDETTDTAGTTNGEMALLLSAYSHTVNAYLYSDLKEKHKKV